MDKKCKELESLVSLQKEQLARYEKRLKDVVTAYKGLLKEKEALDASLSTLTSKSEATSFDDVAKSSAENTTEETKNNVQTLMNSLATLSAEKSRMEASFQNDKKNLIAQITQRDQKISELHAQIRTNTEIDKLEVEGVKAKWIIERQDREKESNNHMLMIRELQKLCADERHLRENIEMQLNNFKTQFASSDAENLRVKELQRQLKEAKHQIKQLQALSEQNKADSSVENLNGLKQVQQEMQLLKEQHAIAIKNEQRRALLAEEEQRKQTFLHENRVANLEARLAELSATVGTYDHLRQRDQSNILTLKQQLEELETAACCASALNKTLDTQINRLSIDNSDAALENMAEANTEHIQYKEDLESMQRQLDASNCEIAALRERVSVQQAHIATLQEKIQVLNRNIDEAEAELKQQHEKSRESIKQEREKCKGALTDLENGMRCKINELEQQLQKQRQRSLNLLDEKEQEIKMLQAMFEPVNSSSCDVEPHSSSGDILGANEVVSADEIKQKAEHTNSAQSKRVKQKLKEPKLSLNENCHMLHYANELARKDIEITNLRKSKYAAESSLHKAIQEKVAVQEELHEKIEYLEEQVDRLERCMSREGANLEYLKNVIINFIVTKDADGKRHMLNAISAVLQLTSSELQTINSAFQKK